MKGVYVMRGAKDPFIKIVTGFLWHWKWSTFCLVGWNSLTITLQNNRDHHKCVLGFYFNTRIWMVKCSMYDGRICWYECLCVLIYKKCYEKSFGTLTYLFYCLLCFLLFCDYHFNGVSKWKYSIWFNVDKVVLKLGSKQFPFYVC